MFLCAIVCALGIVVGVALYCAFKYGWWYYNRYCFADLLFGGGFKPFLVFAAHYAIMFLLFSLCNMFKRTRWLSYLFTFVYCLYCGANTAALIEYAPLWGILYIILIAVEETFILSVSCFMCCCEEPMRRSFIESVRDLKLVVFVLITGFIYKIISFFVILKLLTALI
ncbi:MAG: hypothetical protein NC099_02405 [Corallococcus sp.]|nr:hypothetical protein [Corallococcus sp.]